MARAWTRPRAGRPRRLYEQALVPLAAAAAVALIATTMTVLVPKLLSVQPGARPGGGASRQHTGPGFGAMPRFFAGIKQASGAPDAAVLDVYSSATGRFVAPLPPLTDGYYFQAVAALGNDRTFVAAASVGRGPGGCHTQLWRFTIGPNGQPTSVRPLLHQMPGEIAYNSSLAASADGRVIAFATNDCTRKLSGQVVVIHLATATVRVWSTEFPSVPRNLSLTHDGALLGFVSNPSSGPAASTPAADSAWVLRTGSPSGPLARHYR